MNTNKVNELEMSPPDLSEREKFYDDNTSE